MRHLKAVTPSTPKKVKAWAIDWGDEWRWSIEWTRKDARARRDENHWMPATIRRVLITPISRPKK